MRYILHVFNTENEAEAFREGIDMVNEPSMTARSVQVAGIITEDEDCAEDDYRLQDHFRFPAKGQTYE